jgi:hypothetical protein
MVKILLSLLLFIGTPAYAEELVSDSVVESAPEVIETPTPLSTEIGGWAVVDPETNNVHGVIVCSESFCGEKGTLGGVMPHEYMGCKSGCVLRFQSNATSDGNVAGWHGTQTHIDSNGNVSQTNDGSVKYNPTDKSFDLTSTYENQESKVVEKRKLIPSKTRTNPNGPETGFVSSERKLDTKSDNRSGSVEVRENLETKTITGIKVWLMDVENKEFVYDSKDSALANLDSDVDTALEIQETNDPIVISTIKEITNKIKDFIQGVFRW